MSLQNTIRGTMHLRGIECYGGNFVEVILKPADEDTGVIFQTVNGDIKAKIDYSSPYRISVLLNNGRTQVIHVEHILATLYAYGIDNVLIQLKRIPSKSFRLLGQLGLAAETEVVPILGEREKTLCERIDEIGLERQLTERIILREL